MGERLIRIAAAVAVAGALGLGNVAGAAPVKSGDDEVVVGALLDLSAGWTSLGRASRVTLQLAVSDTNAQLRKAGSNTRVRLRIVDVRGEPAVARTELRRLAAEGVRIIIGPQASSEVKAIRAAAGADGVVAISQGSTAHSLAIAGDNVYRLVPDDIREGEALVALLRRDRVDGLASIWRTDPGNAGLAKSVKGHFRGHESAGVRYGTSQDFSGKVRALSRQVEALRAAGARNVAVYLAAFDEVVDLFRAAAKDTTLSSVAWYGSDGVAHSARLLRSTGAAAFAASRGYPNPTVGLDAAALARSASLRARVNARLGSEPDALALAAYDALAIAVRAAGVGGLDDIARFKRAFVRVANGYRGVTGRVVLNAAGDRAYQSFDFWSVCPRGGAYEWRRTFSYLARGFGSGRIVTRQHC